MSELPKCRLCSKSPVLVHGRSVVHLDSGCPLSGAHSMSAEQWTALMGRGEPVAWMNEHGETLAAEQKATGLYFDCETFTTPLYTQAPAVDGAVLRDAERYRWLRDQHKKHLGLTICAVGMYDLVPWSGDDPDSAIDSAIKGEG